MQNGSIVYYFSLASPYRVKHLKVGIINYSRLLSFVQGETTMDILVQKLSVDVTIYTFPSSL